MFINPAVFKRLINKAFKGVGLTLGNDNGEIFLEGGYWIIRMKEDEIPNKIKAHIIELTGWLPAEGEVIKFHDKEDPQTDVPFMEAWNIRAMARTAKSKATITNVLVQKTKGRVCRVLQNQLEKNVLLLSEVFIDLIDISQLDKDRVPDGPLITNIGIAWENETGCVLGLFSQIDEEHRELRILNQLKEIDWGKEE